MLCSQSDIWRPAEHENSKVTIRSRAASTATLSLSERTVGITGGAHISAQETPIGEPTPAWRADYRATRPKVERKIGHLMRRRHGGRRARDRGQTKVAADFSLLAAAVNLARFGMLGLTRATGPRWVVATS